MHITPVIYTKMSSMLDACVEGQALIVSNVILTVKEKHYPTNDESLALKIRI